MTQPTATSYALLGLLNLRDWTAYELAQQLTRGLRFFWPRAERAVYDEPKRLVARGWATAHEGSQGRRKRTVYSITPAGQQALAEWLALPSADPQLEAEAMLRLAFAESGTPATIQQAADDLAAFAQEIYRVVESVSSGYLRGEGNFPQRAHLVAVTGRFLLDYATMLSRYAGWVRAETSDWSRTDDPAVHPQTMDLFEELRTAAARELRTHSD